LSAIYVLHVFQKKSKRGAATPKADIDLVEARLKRVAAMHTKKKKEGADDEA
jgi:phage-related protein